MGKHGIISRASVFYHAAVMAGSGLILQVLGFAYRLMQSRLVGAEGMGWMSLIMPVYSLITSVTLAGISTAVNHLSAEADALGDRAALPRIFRAGTAFFLGLFLFMAGGLLFLRDWIARELLGNHEAAGALLLFLPCIFLTGFENLCKSVCYGIGRVRTPVLSELGEQTVRIASVGAILIALKPDSPVRAAEAIILGMTVSEVFSSLFMTVSLSRYFIREKEGNGRFKRRIGRAVLALALPVSLSAILGNLISSAITVSLPKRLALAGLTGEESLAALGTVNGMASPLLSLPLAFVYPIGAAVAPRIAARRALGEDKDAERKASKAFETGLLIAFPACLAIYPVSGYLLREVFHGECGERLLLLLTLSAMAAGVQAVSSAVLTGYERQRVSMLTNLSGSLLTFAGMWTLASDERFGVAGYLVACLLGNILPAAANTLYIRFSLRVRIPFRKAFARPFLMAVLSTLPASAVFRMCGESHYAVVLSLFIAFAVDLMLLYVWDYHPIRYLRTLIPKKEVVGSH